MFTKFGGGRLNGDGDRRARLYGGGDLFIHRISTVKTARLGIDTIIANVLVSCKMGSNR